MQALLDAGASPAVAEQLVQGNKINAIKECRVGMGLGLTEAKQLVDRYESALYRYEPWDTRQAR
jgi:ribosomal protein L7/L12